MIRISWLLVSYLAAAIVILAGPDQPELDRRLNATPASTLCCPPESEARL